MNVLARFEEEVSAWPHISVHPRRSQPGSGGLVPRTTHWSQRWGFPQARRPR